MNDRSKKFPKDWRAQIEKSGKLFEQLIVKIVQQSNFGRVVPNYAFKDIEGGESRELDIFGITAKSIGKQRNKWHFVFPILLVAIKDMPLVCFTRREIMSRYTIGNVHISGMPRKIYLKEEELEIPEYLNFERKHHFYKYDRIFSQFWAPFEKSDESKGEFFYRKLIIPLIKALEFEKYEHTKGWYFDAEEEPINLQIYYPIIGPRTMGM